MKNTKKKHKKGKAGFVLDCLLFLAYLALSFFCIQGIYEYSSKYALIALLLLAIMLVIFLLLSFYRKTIIRILRRILMLLLCAALAFATVSLHNVNAFLDELGQDDDAIETISVEMNLYSLSSNEYFDEVISSIDDLDGKSIGIQSSSDEEEAMVVIEMLQDEYDIEIIEYTDYSTMVSNLYYGYVDAALINTDSLTGLEDTYGTLTDFLNLIETYSFELEIENATGDKDITSETFTVLISAQDSTGTPSEETLSDVNMLLIVNPTSRQVVICSIPRDSYVPNPAYSYDNDKLTHTGLSGIDNTMEALSSAFQIDIDFYIKVSFTSLIEIVDALGGIEVDVLISFTEQDENRSYDEEDVITLEAGLQTLTGAEALAYARHRHSYSDQDISRTKAQVQIIEAIIDKILTVDGLTSKLDDIMDIIANYVLTNLTTSQIKSFISSQLDYLDLDAWSISSIDMSNGYAPGSEGYAYCASYPSTPLSIYYLNYDEVINLNGVYTLMTSTHDFSQFAFDVSNLYASVASYEDDQSMLVTYDASTQSIQYPNRYYSYYY